MLSALSNPKKRMVGKVILRITSLQWVARESKKTASSFWGEREAERKRKEYMTELRNKIQNVMDESRMLVLGAEILVGFEFMATFQDGFKTLSIRSQNLNGIALTLMLFTLALLFSPAAFHQIAESGEDSLRLHGFATRVMEVALLPFALGLGANVYIPADAISGRATGLGFGLSAAILGCLFWYGPVVLRGARKGQLAGGNSVRERKKDEGIGHTPVHDKIRQVLTEARVIIPGNQALLGFQFAVVLQRGFSELEPWLKWIHLASLSLIVVSTIILLTPAAYHRIVENGEETERFYRLAHVMVLCSLAPLALGVCGDFFIVVYKLTDRLDFSLSASVIMLLAFVVMWFGYPWLRRNHPRHLVRRPV
jgi:hypothetical protein